MEKEDEEPCGVCGLNQCQSKKILWIQCTNCRPGWYHMSCVGMTRAKAHAMGKNWKCGFACSSNTMVPGTSRSITPPILPAISVPCLDPCYPNVRIIRRVPKSARHLAATRLSEIIDTCVEDNTAEAWADLMNFAWQRLYLPESKASRQNNSNSKSHSNPDNVSLTTKIKNQLEASNPEPYVRKYTTSVSGRRRKKGPHGSEETSDIQDRKFSRQVDQKLSEGDIRGAVRLVSSDTSMAPFSQETLDLLKLKHPIPNNSETLVMERVNNISTGPSQQRWSSPGCPCNRRTGSSSNLVLPCWICRWT